MKESHESQLERGMGLNRRSLLVSVASGSTVLMAGCMGILEGNDTPDPEDQDDNESDVVETSTVDSEGSQSENDSESSSEGDANDNLDSESIYDINAEQLSAERGDIEGFSPSRNEEDASDYDNALSISDQIMYYQDMERFIREYILVMEEGESPADFSFVLSGEGEDTTNQISLDIADETIVYQAPTIIQGADTKTVIESRLSNIHIKVEYTFTDENEGTFNDTELAEIVEMMWSKL